MEGLPNHAGDFSAESNGDVNWQWCGDNYPKQEIIFCSQALLVYIVCIAAIANLSYGSDQNSLWICLLSSALGYMLPNPSFKRGRLYKQTPHNNNNKPRRNSNASVESEK